MVLHKSKMTKIRKSSYDIDLSYFIFQMSNIRDEQDTPSINIHLPTMCIAIHILSFHVHAITLYNLNSLHR